MRTALVDITALFENEARAVSNARADGQIECALELLVSASALLKGADSHVIRAGAHLRRAGRISGDANERLEDIKVDAKRLISAADAILAESRPRLLQAAE